MDRLSHYIFNCSWTCHLEQPLNSKVNWQLSSDKTWLNHLLEKTLSLHPHSIWLPSTNWHSCSMMKDKGHRGYNRVEERNGTELTVKCFISAPCSYCCPTVLQTAIYRETLGTPQWCWPAPPITVWLSECWYVQEQCIQIHTFVCLPAPACER